MSEITFSAGQAAVELGIHTDAKIGGKILRRWLRSHPAYQNAGSGGRYTFTTTELELLRERYNQPARDAKSKAKANSAGLPWSVAMNDRAAVRRISTERVDRLEAALKAAGLHISQMNTPDWRARRQMALADA